jgi:type I restriction enzyme R subunit
MSTFNQIISADEFTVVSEYISSVKKSENYQSEAELEKAFIKILENQGYDYITIHQENDLISNLRKQLELLNKYTFSDKEWTQFFNECLANCKDGIVEKTKKIQTDNIQLLKRDNGLTKNIKIIDTDNIHNNRLQVINQYEEENGNHNTRYDVTILVNGLPLVHVELKRRGVAIKEAFNQINRYQRDSFWASSGLFQYVQIFVISNGTNTKYYSNTTRFSHIKENSTSRSSSRNKTSNSFEFTSYWADGNNNIIADLVDFTKTFLSKHTLLNILTKFCVFTVDDILMVMRPYQICATEKILNRIECSTNSKTMGSVDAGGYIWHTTGSGKTLTSFKTAQLATKLDYIDKVLFVVDRKDLDYQTMKEYNKFEDGCANSNTSTKKLTEQLENPNARIIITTIQKLDCFIKQNKKHEVYKKHVILVFDECHRSQFGDMHTAIVKHFKKYHIFGFTGTPIFAKNAPISSKSLIRTTPQAFGDKLHTYTIVNAINDENVLPFRIDYINTMKMKDSVQDTEIAAIDREKALDSPERVTEIVKYIIEHFDQKTKRTSNYKLKEKRVAGFNSILTVSSIPMAMRYYQEFKTQLEVNTQRLKIATIFSFSPNEEEPNNLLPEEELDASELDKTSRDFLDSAIDDYNKIFSTNYSTGSNDFQNYYKDVSEKVKERDIDLLIVVNMFLTGFDATTLNTLWVDKNLKQHGLIQAFSRTNRILNSVKTFGNIVCFRDLQEETRDAIALFGDKDADSIVLLRSFKEYFEGFERNNKHVHGYSELIDKLLSDFPIGSSIVGETSEKDFVTLFGSLLRLKNILSSFDEFKEQQIISDRDFQDYQSNYIDIYMKLKGHDKAEKTDINDDIVFELELVKQEEINIDYILNLVRQFHDSNSEDKEILSGIEKAIKSSIELRSKKELIECFIESVNANPNEGESLDGKWSAFTKAKKEEEVVELIEEERLNKVETIKFVNNSLRDGFLKTTGTDIDKLLPPMSRFSKGANNRLKKKKTVIEKLKEIFDKFKGLNCFE